MAIQRALYAVTWVVASIGACKPKRAQEIGDAAQPAASAASEGGQGATAAGPSAAPSTTSPTSPVRVPPGVVAIANADAGAPACKLLRGPLAQPFNVPSVLRMVDRAEGQIPELVVNVEGSPRVYDVLPGEAAPQPLLPKNTLPSCAVAGDVFFCPDASGGIHRSNSAGEGDAVVARSRPGTDVSAVALGGHALFAYVAERVTSEGLTREAWLGSGDGAPQRLSEDGSGATFVELSVVGDSAVAMLIDARVAMTPVHARLVTLESGKPRVGADAVIFVGGSAERHNAGALVTSKEGDAFALTAVANGVSSFGMAAITIGSPPKDDAPTVWSLYPNGLDPAPIAATRGAAAMNVARVRPKDSNKDALRVLEVGVLDRTGAFRARCTLVEATFIKDIELESDRQGALWLFYREPTGARLVRVGDGAKR